MIDVKDKTPQELKALAQEIRDKILEVVSKNGGHLSSSLGAVEIILAVHKVFDVAKDPIIFDVSHQAYAHKLLTGRWDSFSTLRQFKGISGFTKPKESNFDYFVAGHSSTSISLAVGAAKAISITKEDKIPVVIIGDGSLSAGMAYEAMNELGYQKYPMIIIINDNEMSIAKPIGAISNYLSRKMAEGIFQSVKKKTHSILKGNKALEYLARKMEGSFRLITPGVLFDELGLDYIGPVDGHDIEALSRVLQTAKKLKKPVVIHAQTTKGKGYTVAQGKHEHWHGVGPFDIQTGKSFKKQAQKSPTQIFSDSLFALATKNEKIVGVTAAMPSGTGMDLLIEQFPNRFWDVAIAEQHAVTSCAALAKEGFKPFCVIYSTFLQRAFDQILHDVAIAKMGVVFAIDRAGIVGEDGETHQGVFDISYLNLIPNMIIFAPRDNATLTNAVEFSASLDLPCAFRYPRGSFEAHNQVASNGFNLGKAEILKEGADLVLIGFGNGAAKALRVFELLQENTPDLSICVVDLRFIKPLDKETLAQIADKNAPIYVLSDSVLKGGVGSIILECLNEQNKQVRLKSFEYKDEFIPHGATKLIEQDLGLSVEDIANYILKEIKK